MNRKSENPLLDKDREFDVGETPETAYDRFLKQQNAEEADAAVEQGFTGPRRLIPGNFNRADYILVEGDRSGNDFPDILVAKKRVPLGTAFRLYINTPGNSNLIGLLEERAGQDEYGLQKPLDPYGFIGSFQWKEAQHLLNSNGAFMPTIRQYVDFLRTLKSEIVYDGAGNKLDEKEIIDILDANIIAWGETKGEFLDAKFGFNDSKKYIHYHIVSTDGSFTPVAASIDHCLNATTGLDFMNFLENATFLGLPRQDAPRSNTGLRYEHPQHGGISVFSATGGVPYLYCYVNPDFHASSTGFREARLKV